MKQDKKLLFIGDGVTDPKSWSGTPYALYSEFIKQGIEVVTYNPYNWKKGKKTKCLVLLLSKTIFPKLGFGLSVWDQMILRYLIRKKMKKGNMSKVFYVANGVNLCDKKIKSFLFCDAIAHERYKYYPFSIKRNTWKDKIRNFLLERPEDKQFMSMSHVFTQSDWVRDYLIDNLKYPSSQVEKVGFGLNIKLLDEEKDYNKNLLLIVLRKGNEKLKGLCLLLEAFKKVKEQVPSAQLAVVGTDGESQEGVTYYYNQPRSTTVELFKQATLYVMPALNEPNGQTYLEGLANKAPIVGLNRFAFPEFCGHGKYGYICQHEDADELASLLISALKNKEELKQKAEAGYQYVATLDYNWHDIVKRFVEVMFN